MWFQLLPKKRGTSLKCVVTKLFSRTTWLVIRFQPIYHRGKVSDCERFIKTVIICFGGDIPLTIVSVFEIFKFVYSFGLIYNADLDKYTYNARFQPITLKQRSLVTIYKHQLQMFLLYRYTAELDKPINIFNLQVFCDSVHASGKTM